MKKEIIVKGVGVNLEHLKSVGVSTKEDLAKRNIFEHLSEEEQDEAHEQVLDALDSEDSDDDEVKNEDQKDYQAENDGASIMGLPE